jgi:hypothetical protein
LSKTQNKSPVNSLSCVVTKLYFDTAKNKNKKTSKQNNACILNRLKKCTCVRVCVQFLIETAVCTHTLNGATYIKENPNSK